MRLIAADKRIFRRRQGYFGRIQILAECTSNRIDEKDTAGTPNKLAFLVRVRRQGTNLRRARGEIRRVHPGRDMVPRPDLDEFCQIQDFRTGQCSSVDGQERLTALARQV
jgi:hypothetical protein